MKTLFITSFHGLIGRNILSTSIIPTLTKRGVRVVVLVPDYKRQYFEEQFGGPNIIIESVVPNRASMHRSGLIFKRLSHLMLPTRSIEVYQGYLIWRGKGIPYRIFFWCMQRLGRSMSILRVVRFLDYRFSPHGFFNDLFERYRPDAVFSTDVFNENDVSLMQDARRKRIPVIGMARSWDNFTVLGLMRMFPDRLMVWNEILKHEAVRYNGMDTERIDVVGVPHYDRYLTGPTMPREKFFRSIHADPSKPLFFFAPIGDLYVYKNDVDRGVLDMLATLDANVLVRFPPVDTVSRLDDFTPPPHMFFDKAGVGFADGVVRHREVSPQDDDMLLDGLFYSDVVLTGPSTIIIEAALFNKPIILVTREKGSHSFFEGVFSYAYNHIGYILESGGTRMANTREELLRLIDMYRADPRRDEAGRKRIIQEQCHFSDGHSSDRAAHILLSVLFPNG